MPNRDELAAIYEGVFQGLLEEHGQEFLVQTAALTAAHWQCQAGVGLLRTASPMILVPAKEGADDETCNGGGAGDSGRNDGDS